jgi:hypothetical protein
MEAVARTSVDMAIAVVPMFNMSPVPCMSAWHEFDTGDWLTLRVAIIARVDPPNAYPFQLEYRSHGMNQFREEQRELARCHQLSFGAENANARRVTR